MTIDIITLFPKMFISPFAESIVKRAQDKGLVKINLHDLRDFAVDQRGSVDDRPYGGGTGMILRVEPVHKSLKLLKLLKKHKTILLTPSGKLFSQKTALKLSKLEQIVLVCPHYEGYDERITKFADEQISIGDYILTGAEIPAMVLIDSITRLIPGVLKKPEAIKIESFTSHQSLTTSHSLLEYPQYTRPAEFRGLKVPKILLSGHHRQIEKWRENQAFKKTLRLRPDLIS